jgi:hypothetical protein
MSGNARAVHSTLRAIGAVQGGRVRRASFTLMCTHAPNFVYPAFALQEALATTGRYAAAALAALQTFFETTAGGGAAFVVNNAPGGGWGPQDETPAVQGYKRSGGSAASQQQQQQQQREWGSPATPATPQRRSDHSSGRGGSPTPPPGWGHAAAASAPPLSPDVAADLVSRAFRAARLGRTEEVEAAVTRGGVSPSAAFEPHRATLLHVAAAHGHRALCRRLLLLGAPPRARDALGRSAAEVALAYRHWEAAELLRNAGVPVSPAADAHAAADAARWRAQQAEQRDDDERDGGGGGGGGFDDDARDWEEDAGDSGEEQDPPQWDWAATKDGGGDGGASAATADGFAGDDDSGGPVAQPGTWRSRSRRRDQ